MRIAEFLAQRVFGGQVSGLSALEGLAGQTAGQATFDATLEDAAERLQPWMPLFFLPIGACGGFNVGVHLRPTDVRSKRVAILQTQQPEAMVEISPSPEHMVFLGLAREEGDLQRRERAVTLGDDVARVDAALGKGFYKPGTYGTFSDTEAQAIAATHHGPSAAYYLSPAVLEDDPERKLGLLESGMKVEPGCFSFYAGAVGIHMGRGEPLRAAKRLAQALACYHHTAYSEDFDALYQTGRELLETFPSEFNDVARKDLETQGDKPRMTWVTELYERGDVELATKILCDLCHTFEDYETVLPIFRKHFEKLGWQWALDLCRFRSGELR